VPLGPIGIGERHQQRVRHGAGAPPNQSSRPATAHFAHSISVFSPTSAPMVVRIAGGADVLPQPERRLSATLILCHVCASAQREAHRHPDSGGDG
jgi:hypothetical protein